MTNDAPTSNFLRTPAIWVPGMSASDWQGQLKGMALRAMATRDFLAGDLDPATFEDVLEATGYRPGILADQWGEGRTVDECPSS
jgi:hypothetical protein